MREVKLEQLGSGAEQIIGESPAERVVLTRGGKPIAIITPVDNLDAEDLGYIGSDEFWKMIAERRKQPRISLAEAKVRLTAREEAEQGQQTKR